MPSLFLNIREKAGVSRKIPVENVDWDQHVKSLKPLACENSKLLMEQMALVYRGIILEDDLTLKDAGLRPGVTVHVLKVPDKETPKEPNPITDSAVKLAIAFKNAARDLNFRAVLQRVINPESLENIIATTPGLREDPVALAAVQDPELMTQMSEVSVVANAMARHPCLVEAAQHIAAQIHEEATASSSGTAAPSAYSYTLDALSDEEDMESSQSSDSQPNAGDSFSAITHSQVAAALAAAASAVGTSGGGGPTSSAAPTTPVITAELFRQALGQVYPLGEQTATSPAVPVTPPVPPFASTPTILSENQPSAPVTSDVSEAESSRRLVQQLQQMRELGLRDDAINLQALQATDWDVQGAINLVFSGVMNDDAEQQQQQFM